MTTTIKTGTLCDSTTNETIRAASEGETIASLMAARTDGGAGHITADGRRCYVEGGEVVEIDGIRLGMRVETRDAGEDDEAGNVLALRPASAGGLPAEAYIGWDSGARTWTTLPGLFAASEDA